MKWKGLVGITNWIMWGSYHTPLERDYNPRDLNEIFSGWDGWVKSRLGDDFGVTVTKKVK